MDKVIFKIKGLLGFCQCKKCWKRAHATMTIKQIGKSIDICEIHMKKVTSGGTLTEITLVE